MAGLAGTWMGVSGIGRHAAPTFAEDVAPIVYSKCAPCHRAGEVAPFSLTSYQDARKRASMIAKVVEKRQMPPWRAVHGYNEFLDENRLSDAEIAKLKAWAEADAPRGPVESEPQPPKFPSGWSLGEPDLIISAPKPYELAAEGEDVYRNFVVRTNFKNTRWVRAIDVRPGNPKVVHHVIAFLDNRDRAAKLEEKTKDGQPGYSSSGGGVGFIPDGSFGGWAPGVRPRRTPPEIAFELKPGATVVLQVHYHKSGKTENDLTKVALYFAREEPAKTMELAWIANPFFRLPAGASNHKVTFAWPIPRDVTAYAAMPHMHLLGKSMKAWVEAPDGSIKPIVYIDKWDFNWQLTYAFKSPMKIAKGSKVCVEAYYDNSAENPFNPNSPPKDVLWGEQTTDEMFLLIVAYTLG
jgi:hypothetical protein